VKRLAIEKEIAKMCNQRIVLCAAFATLGLISAPAQSEWVTVASACVPDESAAGKFEFEFGRVMFLGANTGEIGFRCNVTNPLDWAGNTGWDRIEISYEDTDNFFTAAEVVVTLRRVDKVTGLSFQLASFSSNGMGLGQQLQYQPFSHTFNFANNGYYVGFSVKRTNNTQNPKIQRIRLFRAPPG
jgi:hypothetical protein